MKINEALKKMRQSGWKELLVMMLGGLVFAIFNYGFYQGLKSFIEWLLIMAVISLMLWLMVGAISGKWKPGDFRKNGKMLSLEEIRKTQAEMNKYLLKLLLIAGVFSIVFLAAFVYGMVWYLDKTGK